MQGNGITKAQLAKELGVSRAYITMVANGKRKPSQNFVNKLNRLNVNISYLNMNGVQVVVGSNPTTPSIKLKPKRSKYATTYPMHSTSLSSYPSTPRVQNNRIKRGF